MLARKLTLAVYQVARALAVNASVGVPLLHSLGASHVMAVCGGYAGYSADDVNKFLWMLRLGGVGEAAYRDQWVRPQR